MLIDWVTARLDLQGFFSQKECETLRNHGDRIQRFDPKTGEQRWESSCWESIRSDSHQLSMRVGSDALWVQGSPARIIGNGCAVFGSGASSALDVVGCVERMAGYAFESFHVEPRGTAKDWQVSRIDVTGNLVLADLSEVREALRVLRDVEGGRYRVSQQAGDTVYWSHLSRIQSGKAYAKGPHLRYQAKRGNGIDYSEEQLLMAQRLLRLELKIGSQHLREKRSGREWHEMTADDLRKLWAEYFDRMVGGVEIRDDADLRDRIFLNAESDGRARAAWGLWCQIQTQGRERAREMTTKTSWYRNLKLLRKSGLADADLSVGQVVQLRRRIIECTHVHSWDELRKSA